MFLLNNLTFLSNFFLHFKIKFRVTFKFSCECFCHVAALVAPVVSACESKQITAPKTRSHLKLEK